MTALEGQDDGFQYARHFQDQALRMGGIKRFGIEIEVEERLLGLLRLDLAFAGEF